MAFPEKNQCPGFEKSDTYRCAKCGRAREYHGAPATDEIAGLLRVVQVRLEQKDAEIARLRAALKPFAEFARKFDAKPIRGLDDVVYGIHGGAESPSGVGADLRLSDCRAALTALGEEG